MSSVRNERPIERRKREAHYRGLVAMAKSPDDKANLIALSHLERTASKVTQALHLAAQAIEHFEKTWAFQHDGVEAQAYHRIFGDELAEDLAAETKDNLLQAGALQSRIQDEMEGGPE